MKAAFVAAVLACCVTLGLAPQAQATLIAYEGFQYPSGVTVAGQTGGTGWSNAWSGSAALTVTSPGLTFPYLNTAGNKATFGAGTAIDTERTVATISSPSLGHLWVGFLQAGTAGGTTPYAGISLFDSTDSNEELFIGRYQGTTDYGLAQDRTGSAPTADSGRSATTGATTFLVVDIDLANGTATLYLPPNGATLGAPVASLSGLSFLNIGIFHIVGRNTTVTNVDEIRLGTSFVDVSPNPEPTSLALLGAAGLVTGLVGWRRRKLGQERVTEEQVTLPV